MGLDSHIYCVPKNPKNADLDSPLFEYFEGPVDSRSGQKQYFSVYEEIAYWRKNWVITKFFYNLAVDNYGADECNGKYIRFKISDLGTLIDKLSEYSQNDYDDENGNDYHFLRDDVYKLKKIKLFMEEYYDLFDFYFEGDY